MTTQATTIRRGTGLKAREPATPAAPLRTSAGKQLLGAIGGTEWNARDLYESPAARMVREVEDEAYRAGFMECAKRSIEAGLALDAQEADSPQVP